MKMSLFQIIAIVCLLAVGFLTVTPFLPKADASCGYYSEDMCAGALKFMAEKATEALMACMGGMDSDECKQALQTLAHAAQWANWVCEHSGT